MNKLNKWMKETDDPLLKGPIVSPNYNHVISSLFEGKYPRGYILWNNKHFKYKKK